MGRPWWFRQPSNAEPDIRVAGSEGDGRVLVVTARDNLGFAVERTWVDPADVDQYDESRWRKDWR